MSPLEFDHDWRQISAYLDGDDLVHELECRACGLSVKQVQPGPEPSPCPARSITADHYKALLLRFEEAQAELAIMRGTLRGTQAASTAAVIARRKAEIEADGLRLEVDRLRTIIAKRDLEDEQTARALTEAGL